MSVPSRALRLILPGFAACLLLLGSIDSEASILKELEEAIQLVESGAVDRDDVTMTKRVVEVAVKVPVKGAKERKQVRYARWHLLLDGDQRAIYKREGWPTYRLRESYAGSVTEQWTYADKKVTYVFQGNRLVDTRLF
jgi:hypothetical protein